MKDATYCKRNHEMRYYGCSCGCNRVAHTLQRSKKKEKKKKGEKTRPSQILLKVRCGFRFADGSQTQNIIIRSLGLFHLRSTFYNRSLSP